MSTALTRQNLLNLKARHETLGAGLEILKARREALMKELFVIAEECMAKREVLTKLLVSATRSLEIVRAFNGNTHESFAAASKRDVFLDVKKKNIWGINVAEFHEVDLVRSLGAREVSPIGEGAAVFDSAKEYEKIVDMIVKMASKEVSLERLGEVIRLDTRRVNALEQVLLPKIKGSMKTIRRNLEEVEREEVYRLKRYKTKMSKVEGGIN